MDDDIKGGVDAVENLSSILIHTSIASIHISNQRRSVRVEVSNHLRVGFHIMQLSETEVSHSQS